MLALKVSINGKESFVAGLEDWDSLHAVIMALREASDGNADLIDFKIGGLAQEIEPGKLEHVRWPTIKNLVIGDEITIAIIDTDIVDKPLKRYRSDRTMQENPFTDEEIFELEKQDYLRLKKKFQHEDF